MDTCRLLKAEHEIHYREALAALKSSGIDFMLGGAFAVYYYSNWFRHTHDIDIYVTPNLIHPVVDALKKAEFITIGEQAPGDNNWIYHAKKGGIIIDVIWRFANLENYVEPTWFQRAPHAELFGMDVAFVPLEELLWIKIFVINRHRCDWPDILRIIHSQCGRVDWFRLLELIGEHWLLFAGLIDVFDWQYPADTGCIPNELRKELEIKRKLLINTENIQSREHLLDTWLSERNDTYANWCDEQSDD